MKSIYDAIKEAHADLMKKIDGFPLELPAHLQSEDEACRALDSRLTEAFQQPIQMLQDGLISATEFFELIVTEASKPA